MAWPATARGAAIAALLAALTAACAVGPEPRHVSEWRPISPVAEVGRVVLQPKYRVVHLRAKSLGATLAGSLFLPDGVGPFPAVVWVHGSGPRERLAYGALHVEDFLRRGIAVHSYDKRGVGESGGACCPVHFDLLARDVLANVEALRALSAVDAERIGLLGVSQAGWVVPIAAALDPRLAFAIVLSGPAVSVGEESLFSSLTRDTRCGHGGLPVAAADEMVRQVGPSGFDPRPYLERMVQPSLWVYGLADIHQPSERSVAALEELRGRGKDVEIRTYPAANHFLSTSGPCGDVPAVDWLPAALEWLEARLPAGRPAVRTSAR